MVEKHDINSLLQTGSWRTSRSRSPSLFDSQRPAYEPPKPNIGVPRTVELVSRRKRPPAPCVEDEEESLAKEHAGSVVSVSSDEEPKCRGDIDQQPILLPVHEHNPERRFVIVPGAAPEDEPKTAQARYEANTCRKYVLVDPEKGAEKTETAKEEKRRDSSPKQKPDRPRDIPKRKSHQDLPRLKTDVEDAKPPIRRSGSRRDREKPVVHQETLDSNASRNSSGTRPPDSAFLSPDAVKHTARRRDRAYSDVRSDASSKSGRSPSMRRAAEVEVSDRKRPHQPSNYAPSPSLHRRASSTANVPTRNSPPPRERIRDGPPAERPKSFMQPHGYGDADDIFAFMAPGVDFMTGKPGRDVSPPRRTLDEQSARHPRGAREMPGPSPNRRRQPRTGNRDRERDGYSSDDSYKEKRPYPRRSTLEPEEVFSPDPPRRASTRPLPAGPSLLVTQPTQILPDLAQSNGRSATFPFDKGTAGTEHSVSPARDNSSSPSRRPARSIKGAPPASHSRDASIGSVSNGSGSLPPSVPGSRGRTSGLERELAPQVVNLLRQESSDPQSPTLYWQPNQPNQPNQPDEDSDARVATTSTALAQLPDCRWKHPAPARSVARAGPFLTMKRAENFTICSECYGALFANTEFQHLFVPAPVRSGDQLISCDFGASPWYRIAYIMTVKHEYPDLRLLQAIASVAVRSQACAGGQLATRVWYSMMAPTSRRPIQSFNVCFNCAKMVEALLPNLAGVFVPLDASHEPTRGICELHYAPERKRFFDYFEEMKSTSEQALGRRTAPDLLQLVDRVRDISLHEECLRNTPIPNRKWHVLQQVPEFTVCEDCFNEVVWPLIEVDELGTEIPRNFYKNKQPKPVASCQLYSERMRREFHVACRFDDFGHLAATVLHRMRVMGDIKTRYNELQREDQGDPAVQEELAALARKFKEVE